MQKKIKLLSIIETLGRGGAERVLINTLPELKKLGIDCEVAILFNIDDLAKELEKEKIKVYRLNLSYKWNIVKGVYKLNKLIKKNNYHIIHAHLFFSYFYTGLVKVFNKNIKTVTTFHNLAYSVYPANTFLKKIRKNIDKFIVHHYIDKYVAVSSAVKNHFIEHLKIPHIDIIPNGIPIDKINKIKNNAMNEKFNFLLDKKNYSMFSITPGRLVKEKGHIYLLEAFKKIRDLKIQHFIVGNGPLKKDIEYIINKEKLNNVVLIDSLSQSELFRLIDNCDIVIIPSISEGFGLVVGESMALGKPIIATTVGGIPDMITNEKDGILVPPKNSEVLAKAIKRLYFSRQLMKILANNASVKITEFDIKNIAKKWKIYYEGLLYG